MRCRIDVVVLTWDLCVGLTKLIACGIRMLKPRDFGYGTLIMEGGAVAIKVQEQLLSVYLEFNC